MSDLGFALSVIFGNFLLTLLTYIALQWWYNRNQKWVSKEIRKEEDDNDNF